MRILFVTSEVFPLAKSGGLADVSRALPITLHDQGVDIRLLVPGYNSAITQLRNSRIELRLPSMLGVNNACLISGLLPGEEVPVYLIYAPALYTRPGGIYQDTSHRDWEDNPRRFAYLAKVAEFIGRGGLRIWRPDVVHANDWHAGLVPLFLTMAGKPSPATVFTVHNLAFQGNFAPAALEQAGVPDRFFTSDGVEFYGRFSFLKAALRYADRITTVSPRYGREILTPEFGCGLDGLLKTRERDLIGILNGVDEKCWNPATDAGLAQHYNLNDISGKRRCKSDLQSKLGLQVSARPLFGFISRITHQKMADIVAETIPSMMALGAQVAVSGDGDPGITQQLEKLAERFPQDMAIRSYDEALAHKIVAGADILLAPARFEPCGLTQIYALRYGTIPVVRRTGGLANTVVDAGPSTIGSTATGFVFDEVSRQGLSGAISRAAASFREPLTWRRLQMAAMAQDFSWQSSVGKYAQIYSEVSGLPIPSRLQSDKKSCREEARSRATDQSAKNEMPARTRA